MYYAATQQIDDARHIARSAQQRIKDKTGMLVTMVLYPSDNTLKTPERMLHIIAASLGMNPNCFQLKTRTRDIVELRFIAALCLRSNFPTITLHQIAVLFGGQDHSSIISGLARAHNLIYTEDERFLEKDQSALKAVNLWLRNETEEQ